MSEKIKPGFESGKIKDIEEVHNRLHQFLIKWIKKNEKEREVMNQDIINEFAKLNMAGGYIKLMGNAAYHGVNEPAFVFSDIVKYLSETSLELLNEALESLNKKFPGNEFEPFEIK